MTKHTISADALCDEPLSADEEVAKLRLQLSHKSLEELVEDGLVEDGLVEYDREKGHCFEQGRPLKD